jgi:membrane protein implicated in regulation of membrane protease activity
MRWETTRRYRARPYLAFWVGLAALVTGLGWALATGHWEDWQWALVALGFALLVYGAVVLQMRRDYRRDSKWYREHGPG